MKTDFKKYDKENPAIWKAFVELSKEEADQYAFK